MTRTCCLVLLYLEKDLHTPSQFRLLKDPTLLCQAVQTQLLKPQTEGASFSSTARYAGFPCSPVGSSLRPWAAAGEVRPVWRGMAGPCSRSSSSECPKSFDPQEEIGSDLRTRKGEASEAGEEQGQRRGGAIEFVGDAVSSFWVNGW